MAQLSIMHLSGVIEFVSVENSRFWPAKVIEVSGFADYTESLHIDENAVPCMLVTIVYQ